MTEKVLIRYEGNGSSRYDGKASKLKRKKNSRGPLKSGEQVTIKTKNRVWRAVVVNVEFDNAPFALSHQNHRRQITGHT